MGSQIDLSVGNPTMTMCNKCGLPISFRRTERGKWRPANLDGTDHWDDCRAATRRSEGPVVVFHGRTSGSADAFVWCGDSPPWDESFGEYRPYTYAEKLAGVVCSPHPEPVEGGHERDGRNTQAQLFAEENVAHGLCQPDVERAADFRGRP